MLVARMDEGVKEMTEETKKRLPGIIERIDELRDEVNRFYEAEVEEIREKEMDLPTALDAASDARSLFDAYASLDDAGNILANF